MTNGELKPLGVEGKSTAYSLTWRVPFHITEHSRHEAGLQYVHQTAETKLGYKTRLIVPWVDDRIHRVIPYASFTHYGNSTVLHHKHSFVFALRRDIDDTSNTAGIYRFNSFWQKRGKDGQPTKSLIRSTYLIDENGVIVKAFGAVKAKDNPAQMLESLG